MRLISEFASLDEFLSASQRLYAHDARRYPMYFGRQGSVYGAATPSLIKTSSTTAGLEFDLMVLLGEDARSIKTQPDMDLIPIVRNLPTIELALRTREARALTMSLFADMGVSGRDRRALGRLLSKLHIEHYLNYAGAEIVTGLPGLDFLDGLSQCPAMFNYSSATKALHAAGISGSDVIRRADLLAELRGTESHLVFLRELRLITGTMHAAETAPSRAAHPSGLVSAPPPDSTTHVMDALRTASRKLPAIQSQADFYDEAASRLAHVAREMALSDPGVCSVIERLRRVEETATSRTLILVANETERRAVKAAVADRHPLPGQRHFLVSHTVEDLGILGGTEVLLGMSGAGTESPWGMTLTAADIADGIHPDFVVVVGIAYGLREDEQHLQDILVSTQLRVLDLKKVTDKGVIPRGDSVAASVTLLDRFGWATDNWTGARVHPGPMLSANTLLNSRRLRASLKRDHPDAIGGEMEGAGVYFAGARRGFKWIVVKGISDWGFDKDDVNREPAARNAADFVIHAISEGGLRGRA